jgi:membrane dipeptidase
MKKLIILIILLLNMKSYSQDSKQENEKIFLIDLHNDLLENCAKRKYNWGERHPNLHTDLPRMMEGGLSAQIFAIWVSPKGGYFYNRALKQADIFKEQMKLNNDKIEQAFSADDIERIYKSGKISAILGVEGGHAIEKDITKLKNLYKLGARYLTITWENSTDWAISAKDKNSLKKGLSDLGVKIIKSMDSLGMIIDVSHTGKKTIEDILKVTKNPVIASHSGAFQLRNHYRNLTDEQIKAIANTGGLIGVTFYPNFIESGKTANIKSVIKHINYIVKLVGIDYVGIGSDFDGIEITPTGLEDVSKFKNLISALKKEKYSDEDIRKICGENFLRVFKRVSK